MKLLPYVFITLVIAILTLLIIYLSRRFAWSFNTDNRILFYVISSSVVVFSMLGMGLSFNSSSLFAHVIFIISALLIGFLLYLCLSIALIEIVHIFIKFKPIYFAIISLSLALITTTYGVVNSTIIRTTKYDIQLDNIENDIKIVHLSDIHLGHYRNNNFMQKIVEKSNNLNPDFVVITGDYMDSKWALKPDNFQALNNFNCKVFYVEGNHDVQTGIDSIKSLLKSNGVIVLENELYEWANIQIIGLNHISADHNSVDIHLSSDKATIKDVLPKLNIDNTKPSIMLHHSPNGINYANDNGIDLVLSGHTHAGQLFPITFINDIIFKYNKGIADYNGTKIVTSQGLGTVGPPIRIATKSEIVEINIKAN